MKYIALISAAVLVGIDQLIKLWMDTNLKSVHTMSFLRIGETEIINLAYFENTGAAFGIFTDKTLLLSIITGIFLAFAVLVLLSGKIKKPVILWSVSLIIAGGLGNLIDRIFRGYVIDYLQVELFDFAIFNFADCCVVIGAIMLLICVIFFDKPKKEKA